MRADGKQPEAPKKLRAAGRLKRGWNSEPPTLHVRDFGLGLRRFHNSIRKSPRSKSTMTAASEKLTLEDPAIGRCNILVDRL